MFFPALSSISHDSGTKWPAYCADPTHRNTTIQHQKFKIRLCNVSSSEENSMESSTTKVGALLWGDHSDTKSWKSGLSFSPSFSFLASKGTYLCLWRKLLAITVRSNILYRRLIFHHPKVVIMAGCLLNFHSLQSIAGTRLQTLPMHGPLQERWHNSLSREAQQHQCCLPLYWNDKHTPAVSIRRLPVRCRYMIFYYQ